AYLGVEFPGRNDSAGSCRTGSGGSDLQLCASSAVHAAGCVRSGFLKCFRNLESDSGHGRLIGKEAEGEFRKWIAQPDELGGQCDYADRGWPVCGRSDLPLQQGTSLSAPRVRSAGVIDVLRSL